jgi:hypothetical protein
VSPKQPGSWFRDLGLRVQTDLCAAAVKGRNLRFLALVLGTYRGREKDFGSFALEAATTGRSRVFELMLNDARASGFLNRSLKAQLVMAKAVFDGGDFAVFRLFVGSGLHRGHASR